jgi:hypothetical protein
MQRVSAWIGLVVIATIITVIDPRSLVSVFVCIAPIFVKMIAAPKMRQQSKDAVQSRSIEN